MATKLGKPLTATGQAVLATKEAAANDETGAAMQIERARHERTVLDFEVEVRKRRDAMHAEHLERMAAIFEGAAE
jgi:hypothetical protein